MNDSPGSTPDPATSAAASSPAAAPAVEPGAPAPRRRRRLWPWVLLLLLVAAGAGYGYLYTQLQQQRADSAAAAQAAAKELAAVSAALENARAEIKSLQSDVGGMKEQRLALEQLYSDLARGRDEAALFDVERLIVIAAQELRLTGHVPTAMAALESADARLARLGRPQVLPLRKVLARDLDQLRAAAQIDTAGVALKIDQLAQGVDTWPLLADVAAKPKAAAATAAEPQAADASANFWQRAQRWLSQEFGELVRVREVETPEALLLNSAQQSLVRERMRLRLLDARQAVLARNDRLLRAEVNEARSLLERYFDVKNPAVAQALNQLKTLSQASLVIELPSLDDALAAVRTARSAPPTR